MISEAEVRRFAGRWGVDPMRVDLDYVLGCFLATLYGQDAAAALRFKGGTCLRKCYYADYRFSEDLDFTAERRLRPQELERLLEAAVRDAEAQWQIDFAVRPIRVEVVDDEYGKESYQVRLYYRGPLRRGGDPRAIRLDVTTDEVLAFPSVHRRIVQPYSDAGLLGGVQVPCYDLLEVLAEKVRAMAGQRKYAISRDLYDIAQLTEREHVEAALVAAHMPRKLHVKGMDSSRVDVDQLRLRLDEFAADWQRNLVPLLGPALTLDFQTAWDRTMDFIARVNAALPKVGG